MLSSRWPRSPSHGKCSKRFCGSSRSYGRSHHRETFSMSCIQEQPTEGVRPNARENGQINPSTIVRAARAAGSQPYLPSGFQGRCKIATLHAGFGVIRGMSAKLSCRCEPELTELALAGFSSGLLLVEADTGITCIDGLGRLLAAHSHR